MSKPFLTLDVGSSTIKLAEFVADRDGALQLTRYAAAPIAADPHDEESRPLYITGAIVELLRSTGMKPGKALMTLSGQQVFTRYVRIPQVDEKKIDQIVRFEVQQNVPIPIDQVVWHYQVLAASGGDTDVLLVAVKKDLLESLVASVTEAGLDPELIDIAPLALCNAVRLNYPEIEGCALVVDMGARATNLIFIEGHRVYNRSIPVAGNTITQQIMKDFELDFASAEDLKQRHAQVSFGGAYEALPDETQDKVARCVRSIMTRMHAEISRSISFYRGQQGGTQPARIFLTGGTSLIPYVDVFLKEKLDVEVEYLNPFTRVSVAPDISEEDITRDSHLLAELIGLATRKNGQAIMQVDLMPDSILEERAARRKQPLVLTGLALLLAAGLVQLGASFLAKSALARQVEEAGAQVEELRGLKNQVDARVREGAKVTAEVDTYLGIQKDRTRWLAALDTLREDLPAGSWITSVTLAEIDAVTPAAARPRDDKPAPKAQRLDVQGLIYEDAYNKSPTSVQQYVAKLRTLDLFTAQTNLKTAPVRMAGREDVRMFWIEAVLKDPLPR